MQTPSRTGQIATLVLCALWLLLPFHMAEAAERQSTEYLLAVEPSLELTDIQTKNGWQPLNDGWLNENFSQYDFWLGETPKVAWLKISPAHWQVVSNEPYVLELASSGLSRAELYYQVDQQWFSVNSDVGLQKIHQGNHTDTMLLSRFITFELNPKWYASPIYLRVEATHKLHLQVNIANRNNHLADNLVTEAFFFFCYGILFVMALYNLVIGRYMRDKLYYFYSLAILVTLSYQVFAHGHARLFDYFNWDHINHTLNFLAMLSALTALIFLYHFANFRQFTPKVAQYFKRFMIFFGLATLLTLFVSTNTALNIALIFAGPTPVLAMLVTLWAWYRGSKTAGVFVFAWSFYLLGGFLWVLYWMGMLPLTDWVEIPLVAGAALESILLSLALGYRIQLMQKQGISLEKSKEYYKEISALDAMTKLANRRAFDHQIDTLLSERASFSVALFDIDHFKKYNDTYGHLAGDKVIMKLGKTLRKAIRAEDMAARIGGEEFALVINNQDIKTARRIAERIRQNFSEIPFTFNDQKIYCTVSVGIATVEQSDDYEMLIGRADQALYRAKEKGRNQTQISAKQLVS